MRGRAGLLLAAGLVAGLTLMAEAAAAGKAGERPEDLPTGAGNWSGSKSEDEIRNSEKPGSVARQDSDRDVPIPRPKPGSKAAKAEAEAAKKKAAAEAEEADKESKAASKQKEDSEEAAAVPAPKAKPKKEDDKPVQAGLVADSAEGESAPYRGNMEKDEIKSVLTGKVVASRIDGKDARITLGEEGKLSWTAGDMSGVGFWWTEIGRVCDRYDPSGNFPGRGAGCRSFEQKADGYYSGGKRLQFLN